MDKLRSFDLILEARKGWGHINTKAQDMQCCTRLELEVRRPVLMQSAE
jgi:hypothetical protein